MLYIKKIFEHGKLINEKHKRLLKIVPLHNADTIVFPRSDIKSVVYYILMYVIT